MKRITLAVCLLSLSLFAAAFYAGDQPSPRRVPGKADSGEVLLPNGWTITPAGEQIPVGDLPLAIALHPDGRHLFVSNNGYGRQSVDVVDLEKRQIVARAPVEKAWLGLGLSGDGNRIYLGGGISNTVLAFSFESEKLTPMKPMPVGRPGVDIYPGGLCLAGDRLYVANNLNNTISALDPSSGKVTASVEVGDHPYTCLASRDGKSVYVSLWGAAQVAVVDSASMKVSARIPTDDHPNAMAFSADGKRLFVANANANTISAIDLAAAKPLERISVALYPGSPAGSTTNALAVSPDGERLYAANADNNDVAVVDITRTGQSRILGFIPVGWYPTALAISADGKMLYVANGKGSSSRPNPKGPRPTVPGSSETQFIGRLLLGTISIIPVPDSAALEQHSARVYKNAPYTEKKRLASPYDGESAIPRRVGDKAPIRHVIYIIKENRTYDQVFGDMSQGNGDPNLVLFGEANTPNHHALAREFVLLDNLYCDAEVSADGHNWSMGAYATDYVEKTWPSQYSGRRRTYDYEGGAAIASPSAGYIWDACKRAGVSYRSYGEWVANGPKPGEPGRAKSDALVDHFDPYYRGWDLEYSDLDRTQRFLSELKRFEKEGDMPAFQVLRLPNDHTQGTRVGRLSPRSYVAQNDLALGTLVEGVSKSKFWATTAIFVIEDDAQNGPDHVDAHRTVGLAISPYIRRGTVDSTMYSTSSMLRTMELILGIPPMSQYDAAATPMFASFGTAADARPFNARAAGVSLTETNPPRAPGAAGSAAMRFDEEDAAPELELNEVIWQSIKGKAVPLPAPVRSAFVRPID